MLNCAFHQVYIVVLIICCCNIMEPVELLDADLSLKTYVANTPSNLPRDVKAINILHIKTNVKKKPLKASFNETDNPNNEQKLMVQSFIKSSNNLFECETDTLGEQSNEFYDVEKSDTKSRLQKIPTENSAIIKTKLGKWKSERYNRIKRYMPYYKVGTIRPLDHVRNGQGERRCDRPRLSSRVRLLKDRVIRKRHTKCTNNRFTAQNHRWSDRFSNNVNKRSIRKRRFTNRKVGPLTNSIKNSFSGGTHQDTIEKLFGLSESLEEELKTPPLFFTMSETDKLKNTVKWLRKRQDANDECINPKRRSHCKKRLTTVVRKSINEGKTGKIQFPSTHRCVGKGTCPCSASFVKCAARTTCPPIPTVCQTGTLGRCLGADKTWPTWMGDDMCPVKVTTQLSLPSSRVRRSYHKRCPCDCGCGCPSNLLRAHPDRSLARGSCGCGCGCGCGCCHVAGAQCGVDGTRRSNT